MGYFERQADQDTGRTRIILVGRSREMRALRVMSSLQNLLGAILLTKSERAGPIPDWEGRVVMRCVLHILSWKPSLTCQTDMQVCSLDVGSRLEGGSIL